MKELLKTSGYTTEYWLRPEEVDGLTYSAYWNDEEQEKDKEFNILDGNFGKMERYIDEIGLYEDLEECLERVKKNFNRTLKGVGIDLGAGNLWAASRLLSDGRWDINKLYCLEYSKHRLLKIGPKVLEHYNVSPDKVVLALGSFYELKLQDRSVDFILLFTTFHHADDPDRLLLEMKRILKPQGVVIIMGEQFSDLSLGIKNIYENYLKNAAKFFITKLMPPGLQQRLFSRTFNTQTLLPKLKTFFPTDPVLGDRVYTPREYREMFLKHGFRFEGFKRPDSAYCSYILALEGDPR